MGYIILYILNYKLPNNSNIQNKSHVIHDMTNYMFLRIKTMKQDKNNKNYKDIVNIYILYFKDPF